jgi:hypothetical protein
MVPYLKNANFSFNPWSELYFRWGVFQWRFRVKAVATITFSSNHKPSRHVSPVRILAGFVLIISETCLYFWSRRNQWQDIKRRFESTIPDFPHRTIIRYISLWISPAVKLTHLHLPPTPAHLCSKIFVSSISQHPSLRKITLVWRTAHYNSQNLARCVIFINFQ